MTQVVAAASCPRLVWARRPVGPAQSQRGFIAPTEALRFGWVIGMVALHALLGVLCKQSSSVATLHALVTLALGLYLASTGRALFKVACWGAYAMGAEVLWRMAGASLPWEYAKYAVSLVLLISWLRNRPAKVPWLPVVYFLLLLPAVIPTLVAFPIQEARKLLSFNLSGPLSLAVCATFFSRVRVEETRLQRLMAWLLFSVSSIAAAIVFGLSSLKNVEFGSGANFAASGGFGPNQVSGVLGLGALYGLLLALNSRLNMKLRIAFLGLALWFAAHSALSFSRTGLYTLGASLLAVAPFLSLRRLLRPKDIILVCAAIVAGLATWGYLVRFTGGMVSERFARTDLTGRDRIAGEDLQEWRKSPVFGVGVGVSSAERSIGAGTRTGAHTEYTRLIAEHGLFGLCAGVLIFVLGLRPLTSGISGFSKVALLGGVVLALSSLAASAMRTALPSFLIGLGYAQAAQVHTVKKGKRVHASGVWSSGPAVTDHLSLVCRFGSLAEARCNPKSVVSRSPCPEA